MVFVPGYPEPQVHFSSLFISFVSFSFFLSSSSMINYPNSLMHIWKKREWDQMNQLIFVCDIMLGVALSLGAEGQPTRWRVAARQMCLLV